MATSCGPGRSLRCQEHLTQLFNNIPISFPSSHGPGNNAPRLGFNAPVSVNYMPRPSTNAPGPRNKIPTPVFKTPRPEDILVYIQYTKTIELKT